MANVAAPFGLRPVRNLSGPYAAGVNLYYIPSSDTDVHYVGDPVKSYAGADANGVPRVQILAAGTDTVRGVIVGVAPVLEMSASLQGVPLTLENIYIPATKTRDYYVWVADDPNELFFVQGNGTTAAKAVAANANKNASLDISGTPAGQFSAVTLDENSIATTSTLNVKLIGLAFIPSNSFGAYATWKVKWNEHELMGNTAGV